MVGGAEHANQMICEGLAARGHDVTVVTHQPRGEPLRDSLNGVNIVRVSCGHNRYAFTFVALPTIVKYARNADLIHTTTFNAAPPSWIVARLMGKRILCTVWEVWIGRWSSHTTFTTSKARLHDILERAVFTLPFDRYVAISNATRDRLAELFPRKRSKTSVVYLGFEPARWKQPADREAIRKELGAEDAFLIVGYGRPGVSKGFKYLVEAAPRIAQSVPNALLLLILSEAPQYRDDLLALKRAATANVRFLPSQPLERLVEIVKSADCIAIPSITEGFGYTTLESCASGVPVVASQTTSIPEVIGGAHIYCRPRDASSIADSVVAVHRGQYERSPEKSFSWSATIDGYEKEYSNLVLRQEP